MKIPSSQIPALVAKGLIPPEAARPARRLPKAVSVERGEFRMRARLVLDLVGVVVTSEANTGGKLRARVARKSALKAAVRVALDCCEWLPQYTIERAAIDPIPIKLTRLGGRKMDDDNLANAFKAVRDCIAEWLNFDDGSSAVRWVYGQEAAWEAGIRIEIGGHAS
jgi:hypothetical protein